MNQNGSPRCFLRPGRRRPAFVVPLLARLLGVALGVAFAAELVADEKAPVLANGPAAKARAEVASQPAAPTTADAAQPEPPAKAEPPETIALMTADGKFLRPAADGTLRSDAPMPTRRATFSLEHAERDPQVVRDVQGRRHRVDQSLTTCRVRHVPSSIRGALSLLVKALVIEEIGKKEYNKVESKLKKEYIELPAPTLKDLRRKKRHRVLVYREEIHVRARLVGPPEIGIDEMAYVVPHDNGGSARLMYSAKASLPLRGHVRYRIPKRLSASTGFHVTARLELVGALDAARTDDRLEIGSPELLILRTRLTNLDISNDLLNLGRREIERLINRELHGNRGRIREQGNKALRKAMKAQELELPLLRYLWPS